MKKILFILFFTSFCLAIPSIYKRFTYGFKIAKLSLDVSYNSGWDALSSYSEEEIFHILSQPFSFLGKGSQCYAFLSEDGQYVLKLFRFDHLSGGFLRSFLTLIPFKNKAATEKTSGNFMDSSRSLSAYKLAYEEAREETALLYLHLNPTSQVLPTLHAHAPIGRPFSLPLDQYRFALQKKAESLVTSLEKARLEGALLDRLDAFIGLLEKRILQGIGNTDPSLWRNFAFLEGRFVEIDCGNYVKRPDFADKKRARAELERYAFALRSWLEKNAPESLSYFDERMNLCIPN